MIERLDRRTAHCKVFTLPDGRTRVRATVGPQHVPADFAAWKANRPTAWDDLDHGFEAQGPRLALRRGWCGLTIEPGVIGYRYTSRVTGGDLEVELVTAGGVAPTVPTVRADGRRVWWDNASPDLDIFLQVRPGRVELYKRLRSASAPRVFVWRVSERLPSTIPLTTATAGHDNLDRLAPSRRGLAPFCQRRLVMTQDIGPDDLASRPGWRVFTITETWTGQTLDEDGQPSAQAFFPVLIDQDITEAIAADVDDGNQTGTTTWNNTQGAGTHFLNANNRPGYRFQTVALAQGATIDLATLEVVVEGISAGTRSFQMYGNAVDDAPAWATSAGPNNMTVTTANVTFAPCQATGLYSRDVTTIIQEIVDRAGWASGNDLALGCNGPETAGTGGYAYIEDFAGAEQEAILEIDFTEGGGGGPTLPWLPRTTNLQGPTGAVMLPGGMTPPSRPGS